VGAGGGLAGCALGVSRTGDAHAAPRRIRRLLRAFFREVEVTGLANVPAQGGGILVAWHPNGLVDPALIVGEFPRRVVFGARDGLFKWPVLGALMRSVGTVPIHRAADAKSDGDPQARREANRRSMEALAREVAQGSFAALFPEGVSHDASKPTQMKTGAARLYYQARQLAPEGAPPALLPVGLFYDRKHRFRSRALVEFHKPLGLPPELDMTPPADEPDAQARERVRALTAVIEAALHASVGATEDWATHDMLHRLRKLLRAETASGSDVASLRQEARHFIGLHAAHAAMRARDPAALADLHRAVDRYDRDLRNLGLEDGDLDADPRLMAPGLFWLVLLQGVLAFLLMPPVLVLGFLVNAPVALLIRGLATVFGKMRKDQATIKLLAGVVLYPLAWAALGYAGYAMHDAIDDQYLFPHSPVLAGFTLAFMAMIGGAFALFYLEFARETARSIRVRLTRRQRVWSLSRLRGERARLAQAFRGMLAAAPG
jgi:glycerol-3-phosphate O-acyltransferase/dihydroxyacetone phosphate acyltransferase